MLKHFLLWFGGVFVLMGIMVGLGLFMTGGEDGIRAFHLSSDSTKSLGFITLTLRLAIVGVIALFWTPVCQFLAKKLDSVEIATEIFNNRVNLLCVYLSIEVMTILRLVS